MTSICPLHGPLEDDAARRHPARCAIRLMPASELADTRPQVARQADEIAGLKAEICRLREELFLEQRARSMQQVRGQILATEFQPVSA